jgi:hypothetical protein
MGSSIWWATGLLAAFPMVVVGIAVGRRFSLFEVCLAAFINTWLCNLAAGTVASWLHAHRRRSRLRHIPSVPADSDPTESAWASSAR